MELNLGVVRCTSTPEPVRLYPSDATTTDVSQAAMWPTAHSEGSNASSTSIDWRQEVVLGSARQMCHWCAVQKPSFVRNQLHTICHFVNKPAAFRTMSR